MKIRNTVKFARSNINPLGLAIGAMYVGAGAAMVKVGVQSLVRGSGFQGSLTVNK